MIKVLIVDDSHNYRAHVRAAVEMLGDLLEVAGEAGNGREALAFLAAQPVDLMILDLEMPEMGGLAVLADVSKSYATLPVVVISSLAGSPDGLKALQMGARYAIPKQDLDHESLKKALQTIAGKN